MEKEFQKLITEVENQAYKLYKLGDVLINVQVGTSSDPDLFSIGMRFPKEKSK